MNYDCDFLKPYLESHLLIKTGEVSIFHVSLHNSIDLGDGQFSERCDVDGSFFNSDAILIIFGKSLTSPSSRLFSLTIGNDYFSIILLILGPIILRLFTD